MDVKWTERGFEIVEFEDGYKEKCALQQSSAISDAPEAMANPGSSFLWVGVINSDRMHLSRAQAKQVAELLLRWAETGSMKGGGK